MFRDTSGPAPIRLVRHAISLFVVAASIGRLAAYDLPAHALVQVFLTNPTTQLDQLNRCGYDIAHLDRKAGTVDLVVSPQDLGEIQAAGYAFQVLQVSRRAGDAFGPLAEGAERVEVDSQYRDAIELSNFLRDTATAYPSIVKRQLVGGSGGPNPRAFYGLKISDNPNVDEDESTIFFNGQHHAREVMTPEVVVDIIEYLTTRYATDPDVQRWVNNHEIWLVPTVNPEGNQIVFTVDDFWRKNARDNNNNGVFDSADGVDLNRNYPFTWGGTCNGSSNVFNDETYRGPEPASEAEVKALLAFERDIHPVFSVDYHSYAEEVYYAYGCDPSISPRLSTILPASPDQNIARVVGEEFGARIIQADGGLGYGVFPSAYGIDGNSRDNQYFEIGTIAFVVEMNSAGEGGFAPSYASWRNATVQGQRPAWKYLLDRMDGPAITGHVTSSATGLPLLADVSLDEMTLYNGEVYYSEPKFGRYDFIVVPGTYHVRARAPGYVERMVPVTVGSTTELANVALDPVPGIVLFKDNFEEPPSLWTVGGAGDDATQGQWILGDPYGSRSGTYPGTVIWAAPEFDRSAQNGKLAYVTGNPANPSFGAGDVDGGTTSLVSPSIDASADYAAQVSYWRRFYKSSAEPLDTFTAEVSNDGGSSWTQLEQLTATTASATQAQAYQQASFLLDTRLSLSSTMKLRFRASDRTTDSTIEAAVDEVLVTAIPRSAADLGDLRVDGAASTVISFSAAPGGPTYDVVRGDLAALHIESGQVNLGPVTCIEENSVDGDTSNFPDLAAPDSGQGWFYVARFNLGYSVGSYGTGTGGLVRVPDPSSPSACAP